MFHTPSRYVGMCIKDEDLRISELKSGKQNILLKLNCKKEENTRASKAEIERKHTG
jgi:hypothetical protein